MKKYIGIDLGGTNIAVGIVDEECRILFKHSRRTQADLPFEAIVADIADTVRETLDLAGLTFAQMEAVGLGTPSCINPHTGLLVHANSLHWRNVPLREELEKHLPLPLFIRNDADCAALGEALAGAAKEYEHVLMVTLGTGVGGGMIMGKQIFNGCDHMGMEIGHTKLVFQGVQCMCGQYGCFESYASATALIRQTREAMEQHKDSLLWKLCGGDEAAVTARTAFDAARQGDPVGQALVDRYIAYLAAGLSTLIVLFRPQVILIGGGIGNEGEALLQPLRLQMAQSTYAAEEIGVPPVRSAALGNDAGIIGAAMLGRGQT